MGMATLHLDFGLRPNSTRSAYAMSMPLTQIGEVVMDA